MVAAHKLAVAALSLASTSASGQQSPVYIDCTYNWEIFSRAPSYDGPTTGKQSQSFAIMSGRLHIWDASKGIYEDVCAPNVSFGVYRPSNASCTQTVNPYVVTVGVATERYGAQVTISRQTGAYSNSQPTSNASGKCAAGKNMATAGTVF